MKLQYEVPRMKLQYEVRYESGSYDSSNHLTIKLMDGQIVRGYLSLPINEKEEIAAMADSTQKIADVLYALRLEAD